MTSLSGYGRDYERRISKAKAIELRPHPPKIGYEALLVKMPYIVGDVFYQYLCLQNISGIYVLASHTTKRSEWAEVFGPQYKEFT